MGGGKASPLFDFGPGLSDHTRHSYASRWRVWERWATQHQTVALPAPPEGLTKFVRGLAAENQSVSTIESTFTAISAVHCANELEDPFADLTDFRRAVLRDARPRKRAHAVTQIELQKMVTACENDGIRGLRDSAILLLGYAGGLRRAELRSLTVKEVETAKTGIKLTVRTASGQPGRVVRIERAIEPHMCPIQALDDWLVITETVEGPVFRKVSIQYECTLGNKPLNANTYRQIIQTRAEQAGLGDLPIVFHSLRAGHLAHGPDADT